MAWWLVAAHYALTKNAKCCADPETACFKLSTGDVEDAPALDPIAKFDLVEKNGAVYVQGEESLIKAGRRQPDVSCKASGQEHVVIIGGYVRLLSYTSSRAHEMSVR